MKLFKLDLQKIFLIVLFFILVNVILGLFIQYTDFRDNILSDISLVKRTCSSPTSENINLPVIICKGFRINFNIIQIGLSLIIYYLITIIISYLKTKKIIFVNCN